MIIHFAKRNMCSNSRSFMTKTFLYKIRQATELSYRILKSYKEITILINKKINRFFFFKKRKGQYFLNLNEKRSTDKKIIWQPVKSFDYRALSQLDICPRTDPWITLSRRTLPRLTRSNILSMLDFLAKWHCPDRSDIFGMLVKTNIWTDFFYLHQFYF